MLKASDCQNFLIVNADDFGYFRCVNRGILEACRRGVVTATGVLANCEGFDADVDSLKEARNLDTGVHLNVTDGVALSADMRDRLKKSDGRFPGKFGFVQAYTLGHLKRSDIEKEWRAQIEKCLDYGLKVTFLNSHEHIHMLPGLFTLTQFLANEYDIPYVRLSSPDPSRWGASRNIVRDSALTVLSKINGRRLTIKAPFFAGTAASGALSLDYVERFFSELKPNRVYELMCHPGYADENEIRRPDLLAYHNWQGELDTLFDAKFRSLCQKHQVKLIRYQDIDADGVALYSGSQEAA